MTFHFPSSLSSMQGNIKHTFILQICENSTFFLMVEDGYHGSYWWLTTIKKFFNPFSPSSSHCLLPCLFLSLLIFPFNFFFYFLIFFLTCVKVRWYTGNNELKECLMKIGDLKKQYKGVCLFGSGEGRRLLFFFSFVWVPPTALRKTP
jgi:hypothetical protein